MKLLKNKAFAIFAVVMVMCLSTLLNVNRTLGSEAARIGDGFYDGVYDASWSSARPSINAKLKELGIYDNTILIFTSDNGCSPMADFAEMAAKGHNPNYVFRGHKADIYEGGHRIPLIVRWPEKIKGGGNCEEIVCLSDLMATMAEYFGTALPDSAAVDSVSNLPLWLDPAGPAVREDIIHQSVDGSLSIRKGKFKLEMCPGSGGWSWPKPGEETPDMPRFQLYNLSGDISEKVNIIEQHPAIAERLKKILASQMRNGRSTPGPRQKNSGDEIWDTVKWLEECN